MRLSIGTPETINFSFVPNGKLMALVVPIFKNIRVLELIQYYCKPNVWLSLKQNSWQSCRQISMFLDAISLLEKKFCLT